MNRHLDKETLTETLTFIDQNCKNLNDVMIYVSKRFEHYLQAAEYDKYKTLFDIYRYIKHNCKELMTVENVKDYLQSQNSKSWTKKKGNDADLQTSMPTSRHGGTVPPIHIISNQQR